MRSIFILSAAVMICALLSTELVAQSRMSDEITINYIASDLAVSDLDAKEWQNASEIGVDRYWSGRTAPVGHQFSAKLLWSDSALYVRFQANQTEPLIVSENPNLSTKTDGLWERDVCEIFIAPDRNDRNKYFEFEIAPNGEWIDLGIEVLPKKRLTDKDYKSGMTSAVRVDEGSVVLAIKIPFSAFGKTPKAGDIWLGNLFRCVGKGPTRGYLAWRPTNTKVPSFHVPSKFGELRFVKK